MSISSSKSVQISQLNMRPSYIAIMCYMIVIWCCWSSNNDIAFVHVTKKLSSDNSHGIEEMRLLLWRKRMWRLWRRRMVRKDINILCVDTWRYFKTFVTDNNMLYDDLLAALKLQEI
jgi:hypothetical protein